MRSIILNRTHMEECAHCGEWHCGRSNHDVSIAEKIAKQAVKACEKSRVLAGLMDVKPHLLEKELENAQ